MADKKRAPLGAQTPNEANQDTGVQFDNNIGERGLSTSRPPKKLKQPHPRNRSIADRREQWWWGYPPSNLFERAIRLRAAETCWVEGCDAPASVMPYLFKHYPSRGGTFCSGVDQDCPFLCWKHYRVETQPRGQERPTRFTDSGIWATWVIYRRVLEPKQGASHE